MRTVSYRIDDLKKAVIHIGHVAENEYTRVQVDAGDVYAEYPSAAVSLTVQPPAGEAFPAVVTRDGNMVVWDVKDSALTNDGMGEIQLTFTSGETVVKSCIGRISVSRSIVGDGEAPDPLEDFLAEAGAALTAIPETIDTALAEAKASGEFDGPPGADGKNGKDGADGYTPVKGVDYFDGADGKDGKDGADGADGFSPTATVTKSGKTATITITDKNGTTTETVSDGNDGDPTSLIDDTSIALDKTLSAHKIYDELAEKYEKPSGGIPATDLASGVIPSVPVQDVQVNGTSVLNQGVANVPAGSTSDFGVFKLNQYGGLQIGNDGLLKTASASEANIKAATDTTKPIVPARQHASVFYGLAKASGDTSQSSSANPVGTYTADALVKIQKMLGIYEAPWELIREDTFTNATEADHVITVDGNGNAFELTDVYIMHYLTKQDVAQSIGGGGAIYFYYSDNGYRTLYCGSKTQSAGGNENGAWAMITNDNGAMILRNTAYSTMGTDRSAIYTTNRMDVDIPRAYLMPVNETYKKVVIKSITGTGHYKLYGRRKWN